MTKFGDLVGCDSKDIYSKMHPVSCTNAHHDTTDFINHGWLKIQTWIFWERNINFLQNKKILNLCLRWHILRSYRFLAEVTFKAKVFTYLNEMSYFDLWYLQQHQLHPGIEMQFLLAYFGNSPKCTMPF